MVNADPTFTQHPAVINGCSDFLVAVFGAYLILYAINVDNQNKNYVDYMLPLVGLN